MNSHRTSIILRRTAFALTATSVSLLGVGCVTSSGSGYGRQSWSYGQLPVYNGAANPAQLAEWNDPDSAAGRRYYDADRESVRSNEFIKRYRAGRMPDDDGTMLHEAHDVYVREQDASWNLNPGPELPPFRGGASPDPGGLLGDDGPEAWEEPVIEVRDAALVPSMESLEIVAELNRQREITAQLEENWQAVRALTKDVEGRMQRMPDDDAALSKLRGMVDRAVRSGEGSRAQPLESKPRPSLQEWGESLGDGSSE